MSQFVFAWDCGRTEAVVAVREISTVLYTEWGKVLPGAEWCVYCRNGTPRAQSRAGPADTGHTGEPAAHPEAEEEEEERVIAALFSHSELVVFFIIHTYLRI